MEPEWVVDRRLGEAADLHAAWPRVESMPGRRAVASCRAAGPAVVLGSTQPAAVIDAGRAERAGVAVARRRSGGGAVLVAPAEPVWIDLWVPTADRLWSEDVATAFDWVGDTWVAALRRLGMSGLDARRSGAKAVTRWSEVVCFGGVGRGEVVTPGGRKVVGLAQRRTRTGCWFHTACPLVWDPAPLAALLALDSAARLQAAGDLRSAAVGVVELAADAGVAAPSPDTVTAAFVASLPGS